MKRAALVWLALLISASAHAEKAPQKRVAVAQFDASSDSHARNAVLATLSEHAEVEVVSLEDIAFAGKRLKSDPSDPAGRAKISGELGIDAWIDGRIDGSVAEISLTTVADEHVVRIQVKAPTSGILEQIVGDKTWASVGPKLSERERGRRAQLAQAELARNKIAAREAEVQRQIGLAHQHAEERVQQLKAAQALAVKKHAAFVAELNRQKQLVLDRQANEVAEQQHAEEARRRAEMQRLAAQQPVVQQPAYVASAPASGWGASNAPAASPAWNAQPQPTTAGGVSLSTQRWLQSQQAGTPSGTPLPPAAPTGPVVAPQQQGFAANSGVSPATQRWLEQQQQQSH